ncbi:MAG: hypothetical protein OXT67_07325 [Zetaproteobacteria bacterium]|nr:hypothetical protein [Zetaproteobacteria bacterium]
MSESTLPMEHFKQQPLSIVDMRLIQTAKRTGCPPMKHMSLKQLIARLSPYSTDTQVALAYYYILGRAPDSGGFKSMREVLHTNGLFDLICCLYYSTEGLHTHLQISGVLWPYFKRHRQLPDLFHFRTLWRIIKHKITA